MTAVDVVSILLGLLAAGSGVLVVTTRRLVHAALWLVVTFGALAAMYLVMSAELVAWVQVLIYVGAVVVLLLFGIMLTRAPTGRSDDLDSGNRPAAIVGGVATCVLLVTLAGYGFSSAYADLDAGRLGTARAIGTVLFRSWVLPFELLSVLLLAALVSAIVLSKRKEG
jgi:NADH-quinone oxidoreductase subunit J